MLAPSCWGSLWATVMILVPFFMLAFKCKDISFICVLTLRPIFIQSQFCCVQFFTFDASENSLCFFFLLSWLPHFPFILMCLLHEAEESRHWIPSINAEILLVLFCKVSCHHLTFLVITQLFAVFADGPSFYLPAFTKLGAWVESLVLVLSQRCFCLWPIFLLNTTCNCIFMWNSTMPLQAHCVGVYANDRTRNEPLVGLGFFGVFFL